MYTEPITRNGTWETSPDPTRVLSWPFTVRNSRWKRFPKDHICFPEHQA